MHPLEVDTGRRLFGAIFGLFCLSLATISACQDYTFETREAKVSEGRLIKDVVTTIAPTDILFMIDNSATMVDELDSLQRELNFLIDALSQTDTDYQLGFVVPDIECNIPIVDGVRNCEAGGFSDSCCAKTQDYACSYAGQSTGFLCADSPGSHFVCQDVDSDGDERIDSSNCDGGRLRPVVKTVDGIVQEMRVLSRPSAADLVLWLDDVRNVIADAGCKGSAFEGGLEAVRRAVVCGADEAVRTEQGLACPDPAIADLNQGFIRPGADLVIIFLTDEDDCSFSNIQAYKRPDDLDDVRSIEQQQQEQLCDPQECYAYLRPSALAGTMDDWWQVSGFPDVSPPEMQCFGSPRTNSPPTPDAVSGFLDDIIAAKGGRVSMVRAGGIFGGVLDAGESMGIRSSMCLGNILGESTPSCGCLAGEGDMFCKMGESLGAENVVRTPATLSYTACGADVATSNPGGCSAMGGGRYLTFLEDLRTRRTSAGYSPSVLADSICHETYASTLESVASLLDLGLCFETGLVNPAPENIEVWRNGVKLKYVIVGSPTPGWSMVEGASQICLEGGLEKTIDDRYEIYVVEGQEPDATGE